MRVCLFEDKAVDWLEPLTLSRPGFDLWCGAMPLWQRQAIAAGAKEIGGLVRPALAELCQLTHPAMPINKVAWLHQAPTMLVNARWLPPAQPLADLSTPRAGLVDEDLAYVILPPPAIPECTADIIEEWIEIWKHTLPHVPAGGAMIHYPWDLVQHNPATLCQDWTWFKKEGITETAEISVVGPAENLVIGEGAAVEPYVVADTRNGPVMIDQGAVVHSFSRLEGPCYVGAGSWLLGAKLRGGTIGPACRIGGEVEASIVQGFSNKYHDGFLGHSYVGEWVNLAAGTQVSDLRNDYGPIKVTINGERIPTGLTKVGAFIGDHTKTGLGALINTGSAIGAFCNLLPSGSLLPTVIPSFCQVRYGQLQERTDLRQVLNTAAAVLRRRGHELTGTHVDYLFSLYDSTAPRRRKILRDCELRRLRQSV